MQCTGTSIEPVFSVEAMVRGYNEYQNAFDAAVGEILSCERKVGNIHDTFTLPIKKDGWQRITSMWIDPISAAFFLISNF